jgi:hypothetical protein
MSTLNFVVAPANGVTVVTATAILLQTESPIAISKADGSVVFLYLNTDANVPQQATPPSVVKLTLLNSELAAALPLSESDLGALLNAVQDMLNGKSLSGSDVLQIEVTPVRSHTLYSIASIVVVVSWPS